MKSLNGALFAAALLIGFTVSHNASAHGFRGGGFHHGARVGVFIGAPAFAWGYGPYYYPPYYYPPAYYPPVVVAAPPSPPVYVERSDEQAPAPEASSWYYCPDSNAYYPNVRSCASPWQRVAPQPQS